MIYAPTRVSRSISEPRRAIRWAVDWSETPSPELNDPLEWQLGVRRRTWHTAANDKRVAMPKDLDAP